MTEILIMVMEPLKNRSNIKIHMQVLVESDFLPWLMNSKTYELVKLMNYANLLSKTYELSKTYRLS